MLTFEYNETGKILTCAFTGHLDTNVSAVMATEINDKIQSLKDSIDPAILVNGNIIFDMSGVNYIASSFIRICVSTGKQLPPGNFCIVNCDPFLKKTFKIAGLDDILNVK